jgi:hypothetical protein
MLLTIVLITLPVGLVSFFFSKKIFRKLSLLLGKIDTFDALILFKKEIIYLYNKKFIGLRNHVDKQKIEHIKHDEQSFLNTIDDIIKPKSASSKYPESDFILDN